MRPAGPDWQEYLRLDRASAFRLEYRDGQVVVRAEGPPEHAALSAAVGISTEAYDRGDKFDHYRRIPSLHEYVLVSHREQLVEVFRREASGEWRRTEARAHSVARLESISCDLDVDRLYAGVDLHRGG